MDYQRSTLRRAQDPESLPLPNFAHLNSPKRIEEIQKETLEGKYDLYEHERWWQSQSEFLLARGYKLRRRYRTGWAPSWLGTDLNPRYCEDSRCRLEPNIMDAIRERDGLRVCIKKISGNPREVHMGSHLTSLQLRADPRNRCVPTLDYFKSTDGCYFLVMPYLCEFDEPKFEFVDEVIDFINQTLECLNFLHDNLIAHRDLARFNIMMDAEQLFPDDHHPVYPLHDITMCGSARCLRRRDVFKTHPVRYLFIDFQSTDYFNPSEKVRTTFGQDRELPECRDSREFYSPFPIDVYTLGNVYKKSFLENYDNLAFIESLVSAMTTEDPDDRITASQAISLFRSLVEEQTWFTRRNRLQYFDETWSKRFYLDVATFLKEDICKHLHGSKSLAWAPTVILSIAIIHILNRATFNPLVSIRTLLHRSERM